MFIYIPTKILTAEARGEVELGVECESRFQPSSYTLIRSGTGKEEAVFLFSRAQRRAAEKAEKDIAKKLERDHEDVACPSCGWHQSKLVAAARSRSYSALKNIGNAFFILAGVVTGMFLVVYALIALFGRVPNIGFEEVVIFLGVSLAIALPGLLFRGLRWLLLRNYNSNNALQTHPDTQ